MKPALPLLAFTALALAACQQQPEEKQTQTPASHAANGPDAKPGLTLQGGRLVLPAVKGNPGAAYFKLDNASGRATVLASVFIDGAAKADMHQTSEGTMGSVERVELAAGAGIAFEPGELHVMAFDLDAKLQPGGTTEMTLTFADGDKLSAPLAIEAAGGGMDHGDHR